jgi:hypothetical protein
LSRTTVIKLKRRREGSEIFRGFSLQYISSKDDPRSCDASNERKKSGLRSAAKFHLLINTYIYGTPTFFIYNLKNTVDNRHAVRVRHLYSFSLSFEMGGYASVSHFALNRNFFKSEFI